MAYQVKATAAKPDALRSVLRSHIVEGENQFLKVAL